MLQNPFHRLSAKMPAKVDILIQKNIHLIKYGIIGVCGLAIDFTVYYILVQYTSVHYQMANVISVVITLTNNFLWNFYLNFKVTDNFWGRLFRYYVIGAAGLALSAAGLYVLVDLMLFSKILSKPIVLLFVTLSQYYLNKKITFKE